MFGALTVSASACAGGEKHDLDFWHNFGTNYTDHLTDSFITPMKQVNGVDVGAKSKGSYDGLKEELSKTVATESFPNMATGYPDHFAAYSRVSYHGKPTGILADLTPYMNDETLNQIHKEKYGYTFREDFYEEYMVENETICYDSNDNPLTIGLPFNKSTEVMGYNGIFIDYVKTLHPEVSVPKTWAEMALYGPTFREVQMSLNGKYLCGNVDADGTGSNFTVSTDASATNILLDFSKATNANSAVFSWDSLANMFITLVRQFDSQFTSYTEADRHAAQLKDRHGYMEFYSDVYYGTDTSKTNKQKTLAAMQMVRDFAGTSDATRIFAHPAFFSEGSSGAYSSDAFAANKVMFTICSTGGLTYNLKNGAQRFRIAPVPYKDATHKYVISQGANLTVFNKVSAAKPELKLDGTIKLAFETLIRMSTGSYQAEWAKRTGYYPASRSASNDPIYKDFLAGADDPTDPEFTTKRAYREGAKLNNDEYMNPDNHWVKFVDPGFVGSAEIRSRVDTIVSSIVSAPDTSLTSILDNVYADSNVKDYVRK